MDSKISKIFLPKYLLLTIFLIALVIIFLNLTPKPTISNLNPTLLKQNLQINTKTGEIVVEVEIAKTQSELTKGLSNRKTLAQDSGMYFELGKRQITTFWMKEMLLPLDLVWIDNGTIVKIDKNAPTPFNSKVIPTFNSETPVTNVLEVNAGFSTINKIEVTNKIKIIH